MPTAIPGAKTDATGQPGSTGPKAKLSPQGMDRVSLCFSRGAEPAVPTIKAGPQRISPASGGTLAFKQHRPVPAEPGDLS